MLQKMLLNLLFILSATIIFQNCDTTEPGNKNVSLTIEDVSSTEVWLNVKTELNKYPQYFDLFENGEFKYNFEIGSSDTTLFIKFLNPSTSYSFFLQKELAQSNKATVTTLDTTSHNINWQTFTFGGNGSSYISDVAIIDENNIWAVGAIYANDSLGNSSTTRFNSIHWDGKNWTMKRIPYYYQAESFYHPIKGIFSFNQNDIWFCGNGIIRWDGNNYIPVPLNISVWGPYQMNKIWGTSNKDLYVVGNAGNIAHFDGQSWKKIESGTEVDLTDVYGNEDGSVVWACGRNRSTGGTVIIEIKNDNVSIVFNANSVISYNGLWVNGNEVTAVGTRIRRYQYTRNQLEAYYVTKNEAEKIFDPGVYIYSTTGTGKNDVFIAGGYGSLWHFNGRNWYKYENEFKSNRRLSSVVAKDNVVVAVGNEGWPGLILLGKR